MKLTIRVIYNRFEVLKAIRKICPLLKLKEVKSLVDGTLPIVIPSLYLNDKEVMSLLENYADFDYSHEKEEYLSAPCPSVYPHDPEQEDYLLALAWFGNLSNEDQDKVRCLIRHSQPTA